MPRQLTGKLETLARRLCIYLPEVFLALIRDARNQPAP